MAMLWGAISLTFAIFTALLLLALIILNRDGAKFGPMSDWREQLRAIFQIGVLGPALVALILPSAALAIYAAGRSWDPAAVFESNGDFIGILIFLIDQAIKGVLLDLMEVYNINLPGSAELDTRKHWALAVLLIIYRAAFASAAIYLAIHFIRIWFTARRFDVGRTRFVLEERRFVDSMITHEIFAEWVHSIDENEGARSAASDGSLVGLHCQLSGLQFIDFVIASAERGWTEGHRWERAAEAQSFHDRLRELNPNMTFEGRLVRNPECVKKPGPAG
ncbi:hypothetical protein [Aurantimonas endophytica]|uniref:Uncharacterized protein n=1 Tax=Aurantimonas endophytica TaxID=1522175 RepID=A0A7W6MPK0_9HYPH|nr:hypothetical protein [Aurantimonas endophytica]MBB4003033.1 hypothetical protein [Aurantimonas endophytica]MCO6403906.1 hypothetical protein [Aurantimonas endophytica]